MNCPQCNTPLAPEATACPACGCPVQQQYAQQGYQQPPQQPGYAPQGGYQQQPQNGGIPPGYDQKSRMVYILLALFLGGLGIHNFYAGHTQNGVIQLILGLLSCGGISFIWAIIDMITVKTDGNGVPMK